MVTMKITDILEPNSNISAVWQKEGIEFHWWTGCAFKHKHGDFYEILIIAEGACSHITEYGSETLGRGVLVFMPKFSDHEIQPALSLSCVHMNFSVEKNLFKALCDIINPSLYDMLNIQKKHIVLSMKEVELEFFIESIRSLYVLKPSEISLKLSTLKMLISVIINFLDISVRKQEKKEVLPQWFSEILYKLNMPENMILPLSEIYKMSNYSPSMFWKYFKAYMNETPHSYMTRLKIKQACRLLSKTNDTVLSISNALNFDSLSHFSYMFKKQMGMTPMQYRKNLLFF